MTICAGGWRLPYNALLQPEKNWDLAAMAGTGGIRSTVHDSNTYA